MASSEASYESAASEGGYESASDRGRDVLPRIVSASHCVEVFRHLAWGAGWSAELAGRASRCGAGIPEALRGLPPKMLRFDGAIEAWLEEMPPPANMQRLGHPYASVNDAAGRQGLPLLNAGNQRATIWYFSTEFHQVLFPRILSPEGDGITLWKSSLLDRCTTIQSSHKEVGRVNCVAKEGKERTKWLKDLFSAMQAYKWTPNAEARIMLVKHNLGHASMSVGDAVQVGKKLYIAGLEDFIEVNEATKFLPQTALIDNEEPDIEPTVQKKAGKAKKSKKGNKRSNKVTHGASYEASPIDTEASFNDDGNIKRAGREGYGKGTGKKGKNTGKGKSDPLAIRHSGVENKSATSDATWPRTDRRAFRTKLQAERERLRG